MSFNNIETRIKQKRGTLAYWEQNSSFVPLEGEIIVVFVEDNKTKIKIGDGIKTFAELEYISDIESYTETDPTVPAWAKADTKPTYTAIEVGADPAGTAQAAVDALNVKNGEGEGSVVAGLGTVAQTECSYTIGKYNKPVNGGFVAINNGYYESGQYRPLAYIPGTVFINNMPQVDSNGELIYDGGSSMRAQDLLDYFYTASSCYVALSKTTYIVVDNVSMYADINRIVFTGTQYDIVSEGVASIFTIGNGTSDTERANAHTTDWNGNAWYAGSIKIGGTGATDSAAKEVATKEYVETYVNEIILGGEW